jgi:hypothetical protein
MNKTYQYFKIKNEKKEYFGEKYDRVSFDSDSVLCISFSILTNTRRGHHNSIGVYVISRQSFATNYFSMDYLTACNKKEFDNKFDKIVRLLK